MNGHPMKPAERGAPAAASLASSAPTRPKSAAVRYALLAAGHLFVALAVIGIFVPLLPTTDFLLLAAACYARASHRFHRWLLSSRLFGPILRDWHERRQIAPRSRAIAIGLVVATLGGTALLASTATGRVALLALAGSLVVLLLRIGRGSAVRTAD
jgi:uncharacterized membrane protein YbaN (DUF454 family)